MARRLDYKLELPDAEYRLRDGAAWIEVGGFAVRIFMTDEGVVVDVYENGNEERGAIASTYAFTNELERKK